MSKKLWAKTEKNKKQILEEFLQYCHLIAHSDLESIKNLNSKQQTIKKHYAQQKRSIEHQFKKMVALLDERKQELLKLIDEHEQQLDQKFIQIHNQLTHVQEVVEQIQNDIVVSTEQIVTSVDDETFNQILNQFREEIQNSQLYKRDILSQKITLKIIEEWTLQHQEAIQTLINSSITLKDYAKQIETPSEMTASTSSNKSQDFQQPLIISFDQRQNYFIQKSSQTLSESEIQDSCESDFLREWANEQS